MNERIKELAEQARKYARDYVADCKHYGYYMERNEYELQFEEKFAELIVEECAELVKDFFQEDEFTCYNAKTEITKHFGVE